MGRVLADEDRLHVLDRRLDDARPAGAFADAIDALVGHHLDEQPVARRILHARLVRRPGAVFRRAGLHQKRLYAFDLHAGSWRLRPAAVRPRAPFEVVAK